MLSDINNKTVKLGRRNIRFADITFVAVLAGLAVYFFVNVPYGMTEVDEASFLYSCFRRMTGDKIYADDWNFANLFTVFIYFPFRIFYLILGGTQGIIIAFRYLYSVLKLVIFSCTYFALRKYGFWAVLAGSVFVGTDFFGLKTISYYTVCVFSLLLCGLLLFIKKEPKPLQMIAAGVFFSWAVIAEPGAAVVWFVYSILVLICCVYKKRNRPILSGYDFILSERVWKYTFFGIAISAVLFLFSCAVFFTGTDLNKIVTGFIQALNSSNYETVEGFSSATVRLYKYYVYFVLYNRVFVILFAAVYFFGVCLHRYTKKFEKPVFILLSVLFAAMSVHLILYPVETTGGAIGECSSHALLLTLLGAAAYVFTPEKNRKMFAFLLLSFAVSFMVDLTSNVTFCCVLLVGVVPSVILLRDYLCSQFGEYARSFVPQKTKKQKRKEKPASAVIKVWLAALCALPLFIASFEVWHYVYMADLHETEEIFVMSNEPLDSTIPSGIYKGIITTASISDNYQKSLRDAGKISELCKVSLYIMDCAPSVYLDSGVRAAEPWLQFFLDDWKAEELWWELHPDLKPDVFYIPYTSLSYMDIGGENINKEKLAYLNSRAEIKIENGEAGYIVKILSRHN